MMRTMILGWAGLAAVLALVAPAASQYADRGRRPGATFFVKDGYEGRSVFVDRPVRSFREFDMQDKASSILIQGGRWLVCEHDDFQGRCETIDRSVKRLSSLGMDDIISSARPLDDFGGGRPGYSGGRPGYGGSDPLPGGSWAGSCRGGTVNDDTLSAQCNDGRGGWHYTEARVRDCRSGRYGNRYGDLICE